ncbi:hypothetical protein SISNIDRAFT_451162 [Sistotremastrum niveocremeum HHB9708]|uniref:Uncharacterized protein n=1 Tax=Sistotremastrum niveocremeum HHB9708 TaxID=1314777 RepID=A0A164XZ99_9AGAM|nr:hypothetical protein SISNIDRAFT_451162 [Sistotremastrum niveocremeum HHB9708]
MLFITPSDFWILASTIWVTIFGNTFERIPYITQLLSSSPRASLDAKSSGSSDNVGEPHTGGDEDDLLDWTHDHGYEDSHYPFVETRYPTDRRPAFPLTAEDQENIPAVPRNDEAEYYWDHADRIVHATDPSLGPRFHQDGTIVLFSMTLVLLGSFFLVTAFKWTKEKNRRNTACDKETYHFSSFDRLLTSPNILSVPDTQETRQSASSSPSLKLSSFDQSPFPFASLSVEESMTKTTRMSDEIDGKCYLEAPFSAFGIIRSLGSSAISPNKSSSKPEDPVLDEYDSTETTPKARLPFSISGSNHRRKEIPSSWMTTRKPIDESLTPMRLGGYGRISPGCEVNISHTLQTQKSEGPSHNYVKDNVMSSSVNPYPPRYKTKRTTNAAPNDLDSSEAPPDRMAIKLPALLQKAPELDEYYESEKFKSDYEAAVQSAKEIEETVA